MCALQLREVHTILDEINAEVVAGVKAAISRAQKVCCYGVGREQLVLKGFAIRLHQMRVNVGLSCVCYMKRNVGLLLWFQLPHTALLTVLQLG